MYNSYAYYKGWNCEIADYCHTEMGKLKEIGTWIDLNESYKPQL